MTQDISSLMRKDSIMFEYDVHDMKRAVKWYKETLGLEVIFEGGDCHTEFALPVKGSRLALTEISDISGKPYPNYVLRRFGKMYFAQTLVTTDSIRRSGTQKYTTKRELLVPDPHEHWIENSENAENF